MPANTPRALGLYQLLQHLAPGPLVTLNRIVTVAMVRGAPGGLEQLAAAEADPALTGTTGCTPSVRTRWRWLVTGRRRPRCTGWRPGPP